MTTPGSPPDGVLLLGAPLSLSGRYAQQGIQAAAGLQQAVEDAKMRGGVRLGDRLLVPDILIVDDGGTRAGVVAALEVVAGAHVLVGPYGSDLAATAGRWAEARSRTLFNHGGSADEVQRLAGVVSVCSPASGYFPPVLELLSTAWPAARVLLAVGPGGFGQAVAAGVADMVERLGMELVGTVAHHEVSEAPAGDIVLIAGRFEDDIGLVHRLRSARAGTPMVAAVGAGLSAFGRELGPRAEGVLAPSQWDEGVDFRPDVGPRQAAVVQALRARVLPNLPAELSGGQVDYPAAQAYAAALIALHCVEQAGRLDDDALEQAARGLHCTTFFGRFGLGDDRRQDDHEVLVVQWQRGVKRVVGPAALAEAPLVN